MARVGHHNTSVMTPVDSGDMSVITASSEQHDAGRILQSPATVLPVYATSLAPYKLLWACSDGVRHLNVTLPTALQLLNVGL